MQAKLALSDGEPARALELAADGLSGSTRTLRLSTAIKLRLSAVASHQRGNDDVALEFVEQALSLAEPEGYLSPFLAVGAPLRELLVRRIRAGTAHRSLAGELGEALDPQAVGPPERRGALLLEPLSDRETAVLRYLPTALSKAEIASEMFVSVNTVKTHMKNIYRKLDVTDRLARGPQSADVAPGLTPAPASPADRAASSPSCPRSGAPGCRLLAVDGEALDDPQARAKIAIDQNGYAGMSSRAPIAASPRGDDSEPPSEGSPSEQDAAASSSMIPMISVIQPQLLRLPNM